MIALVRNEDLGLVLQPPERTRVDDAIPVAGVLGAVVRRHGPGWTAGTFGAPAPRGIDRQPLLFEPFEGFLGERGDRCGQERPSSVGRPRPRTILRAGGGAPAVFPARQQRGASFPDEIQGPRDDYRGPGGVVFGAEQRDPRCRVGRRAHARGEGADPAEKLLGARPPRRRGADEDDRIDFRKKRRSDPLDVLVGHGAENEIATAGDTGVVQEPAERAGPVRVVAPIEKHEAASRPPETLDPAGPAHAGDAPRYRRRIELPEGEGQNLAPSDGKRGVPCLVLAGQRRPEREPALRGLELEGGPVERQREVLYGKLTRRVVKPGARIARGAREDGESLRVLRPDKRRTAAAKDPRFFSRDLRKGLSELCGVVERDGGDDRERGGRDVGGVEAAPEPDLEDREIDAHLPEQEEGGRRGRLEVRQRHLRRARGGTGH